MCAKAPKVQIKFVPSLLFMIVAVLSSSHKHLHEKTENLHNFAEKTGVNINTSKTQTRYINTSNDTPITVDDKPLERVDGFTYLGCIVGSDNGAGKGHLPARVLERHNVLLLHFVQSGSLSNTACK